MIPMVERAQWYRESFPRFPDLRVINDRVEDLWFLGNDYSNGGSKYYGAYPTQFMKRMEVLFQDATEILHLFAGSLPPGNYTRFDRKGDLFRNDPSPEHADVVGEAEILSSYFNENQFDLIYADPPYSKSDAKEYGTILLNRGTVIEECRKILQPGGYLVWLDQVLPMFTKMEFHLVGAIGLVISTNHRFRIASIFQKQ